MTDHLPSKEQIQPCAHGRTPDVCRQCMRDEIGNLRRDNVRWENAHKILLSENDRLRKQVEELSIHAEKWVKRALGGDRASVFANPVTDSDAFVVTAGQVTHYTQPPSRYSVEPHGDGHALYFGRDHMHHGFNLARITEATPETLRLIEQALNAGVASEPRALSYEDLVPGQRYTPVIVYTDDGQPELQMMESPLGMWLRASEPPGDGHGIGLLGCGDPIPEGGCGCRMNGVPIMQAQCKLHGNGWV